MQYSPPVARVETKRGHYYKDGQGQRIPGVTTILGDGLPKAALINWAANATAEAAVNRWDELSDMPPAQRLDALKRARYETTDKAKRRGTEVHGYAERLVQGEEVTGIPDELRGHVEAYARFVDAFNVQPVLVEVVIVNYTIGYAGTLDLVAEIDCPHCGRRCTWLMDVKTNEKGIYAETSLQLAAYRYSEFYVDADGKEQPMIAVDHCGAVHVTSDEALLVPTLSWPEQFKTFRIASKVRDWVKSNDELVLNGIRPPDNTRTATARIVWEEATA